MGAAFLPHLISSNGAIGGMAGYGGGAAGTGFAGPQSAQITPGTNAEQIGTAYGGAQNSLQSQQALLQALQGQNGIQNQSQVYGQLQQVAAGQGPNPAMAMLNQATGANVANQAALMAGQRGAGANAGLMARQAAQQGGALQQQAVGQGATMQANQSLNALGAAGNMATQQAGQQIGQTNANVGSQLSEQQLLQNSLAQQNNANVGMQGNINQANAGLAQEGMRGQQGLIGGVMSGIGGALGMASGGQVPGYADDGIQAETPNQLNMSSLMASLSPPAAQSSPMAGGMSKAIQGASSMMSCGGNVGGKLKAGGAVPGKAEVAGNSYSNDTVNAKLSPGELVIDRETMQDKGPAGQAARALAALIQAKKRAKK